MRNEQGFILITALLVMVLLTGMGIVAISVSNTEVKIATNSQIHWMEFYAAEAGAVVAPIQMWNDFKVASQDELKDVDFITYNYSTPVALSNGALYDWKAEPALDDSGNVLLYGDEDGDALYEVNTTKGVPMMTVVGKGTHPRGGVAKVEIRYRFEPIFALPDAALRVHSHVNGNGVSGSISGIDASGTGCADVPGISYDIWDPDGNVDYGGTLEGNPPHTTSGGLYPMSLISEGLVKAADLTMVPDANDKVAADDIITSEADPQLVVITGNAEINNLTGWGILYVQGDLTAAGSLDWHGIILTDGNLTFSGGGSKTIYGSVIAMGDAIAINGGVDIQYDCTVVQDLYNKYSSMKTMSWRQL